MFHRASLKEPGCVGLSAAPHRPTRNGNPKPQTLNPTGSGGGKARAGVEECKDPTGRERAVQMNSRGASQLKKRSFEILGVEELPKKRRRSLR